MQHILLSGRSSIALTLKGISDPFLIISNIMEPGRQICYS